MRAFGCKELPSEGTDGEPAEAAGEGRPAGTWRVVAAAAEAAAEGRPAGAWSEVAAAAEGRPAGAWREVAAAAEAAAEGRPAGACTGRVGIACTTVDAACIGAGLPLVGAMSLGLVEATSGFSRISGALIEEPAEGIPAGRIAGLATMLGRVVGCNGLMLVAREGATLLTSSILVAVAPTGRNAGRDSAGRKGELIVGTGFEKSLLSGN
jgi:hypothetical protein